MGIKENFLQVLKDNGITEYKFYKESGISRGTLSNSSGLNEESILKFFAYFPHLDANDFLKPTNEESKQSIDNQAISHYMDENTSDDEIHSSKKNYTDIKGRIVNYIEKKSISKENFYRLTDISPSNFKGKGALSEVGGDNIVKVLTVFKDLSPDWLLLGKGQMLRQDDTLNTVFLDYIAELKKDKENLLKINLNLQSLIQNKI